MADLEGFDEEHPLNSRLVKQDGRLVEEVYRVGGRYGAQIAAIVAHLEAALPYATEPMAKALRALIAFYRTGDDRRPRGVRHRLGAGQSVAGRHDQRLRRGLHGRAQHQGRVGSARLLRQPREDDRRSGRSRSRRSGSKIACRGTRSTARSGVHGVTANAIDVVIETGESGPITPVGINLPNDQGIRERYGSKSVSLSNVNEAYDKSTLPEFRSEFSWTAEEAGARDRMGRVRRRADDQHARSDRPRLGQGRRAAERESAGGAEGTVLGDRRIARRSRRAVLPARSQARRVRPRAGGRARGHRPRRVRGLHAQCARAAAARPRGDAHRRRPHAQPPDDRPLADGAHDRDRRRGRATARPTT